MDESRRWIEWFLFWIIATLFVLLVASDVAAGAEGNAAMRGAQTVSSEAIVDAAQRLLKKQLQADDMVVITPLQMPQEQILPAGRLTLTPILRGEVNQVVPVVVELSVDGNVKAVVPLAMRVDRYQQVVVAARPIRRLAAITPEDLRIEKRLVSGLPAGPLDRVEEAIGFLASREIRGGEALSTKLVQLPALVKRGEIVTLIVEGDGVVVTARGQAKEEGQRGQLIRVMNLSSKKELYGRVEGERQVKIPF
ncbi:MAG TPA: flagellar basal body P-ring formation chaperone FlgA [Methylomirabilota bacterium]|nr:flagellar basal body P-ring formation chaperone FlgA [Methylomirabilota bacterium]